MKANMDGIAYPRATGSAANAAGVAVGAKSEQTAGAVDSASGAAKREITRDEALSWLDRELKKGEESRVWYTADEVAVMLGVKKDESSF